LNVTDKNGLDRRVSHAPQPTWEAEFTDPSNRFVRTSIVGFREGTFLTTNEISRYENRLKLRQPDDSFNRFEVKDLSQGYIELNPWENKFFLVAKYPDRKEDILICLQLPFQDCGLFYQDTPETHEYYERTRHTPGAAVSNAAVVILKALK
jgi:hypothetical protein